MRDTDPRLLSHAESQDVAELLKIALQKPSLLAGLKQPKSSELRLRHLMQRLDAAPPPISLSPERQTQSPRDQAIHVVDQICDTPSWGFRESLIAAIITVIENRDTA